MYGDMGKLTMESIRASVGDLRGCYQPRLIGRS